MRRVIVVFLPILAATLIFAGCGAKGGGGGDAENTIAACQDGVDNDGDGFTDCADQDCQIFAICVNPPDGGVDAALTDGAQPDAEGPDADLPNCATGSYVGEQEPAALLIVLDRSESMAQSNKWTYAVNAIVDVLDRDVFNTMHVGLYSAPSGYTSAPSCIAACAPNVACATPPFPQVPLALAGTDKSTDPTGVRRDIRDWLVTNGTMTSVGEDASPLFAAIEAAIMALNSWPETGKRILIVVTDGTISCTSLSVRTAFNDCTPGLCGGPCADWEHPNNIINDLLIPANTDPQKPIESFVIGVPGSDTYDQSGCAQPPYRMRAALSAMAYAGSPANAPVGCDGTTFTQSTPDPTSPCHFDMTQGNFSEQTLVDTMAFVRGQTMGCIFELPDPGQGQEIDLDFVNVRYTLDGGNFVDIPRRGDPQDECLTAPGCWDYTADNLHVELIGAACDAIKSAMDVQIDIYVGCETVVR